MRELTAAEAAALVQDGSTVAISGGSYRAVAENVLAAMETRFLEEGACADLSVVAISMVERGVKGKGGAGTGLNRLAHRGMLRRIVSGSYARNRDHQINVLAKSGEIPAYNIPMGTIVQWLRAVTGGRSALLTPVGIDTFVDPRATGGRLNDATPEWVQLVEVGGEPLLRLPCERIDVALIKASAADDRGNLFFDHEAYDHGAVDAAMAAHNSGGIVIAEVNRRVRRGELGPRLGSVPGPLVDVVVVVDPYEDEQDPRFSGGAAGEPPVAHGADTARTLIADAVVASLPRDGFVNLGAGMPMYDVPAAAARQGRDDLYFTVEQGPMGGWPVPGGAAIAPELILGQSEVFDLYEGGGPDVSVLAFAEVDARGNVNVSRFGDMLPGSGGFVNIVHGARRIVFCGTLTTGGLGVRADETGVSIETEGRIGRFVPEVEQVTFSARRAIERGVEVVYVTERAQFRLTRDGLELIGVSPGIDVASQILAQIPFPVAVPLRRPGRRQR